MTLRSRRWITLSSTRASARSTEATIITPYGTTATLIAPARDFLPSAGDTMFLELEIFERDVPWPTFEAHTYASWARDPSLLSEPLPLTIPLRYGTLQLTTALSSGE